MHHYCDFFFLKMGMKKDNPGTVRTDMKAVKMQMQIVMDREMGKGEATGGWDSEG